MPVDLFLQLQWAYVQSDHMSSRERAMHKLNNTDFPHLAVITAKCPTCPQQRLSLSLRYDILPRAPSQLSSGTMVTLVSFYYGGITRSDTYSGYWFAFLFRKLPSEPLSLDLENARFIAIESYTTLPLIKGHLWQRKYRTGLAFIECTDLFLCPIA